MRMMWCTIVALAVVIGLTSRSEAESHSRVEIAQTVLTEVEQRFDALPWARSIDGEFSKLGAYGMHAFPGYSWAVLRKAVKTGVKQPSFLLGDSLLEQVQYLYLHHPDEFEQKLKNVTSPDSELWRSSPLDTLKFAQAMTSYSTSDAAADDVMCLLHFGTLPFAIIGFFALFRWRRSVSSEERAGLTKTA